MIPKIFECLLLWDVLFSPVTARRIDPNALTITSLKIKHLTATLTAPETPSTSDIKSTTKSVSSTSTTTSETTSTSFPETENISTIALKTTASASSLNILAPLIRSPLEWLPYWVPSELGDGVGDLPSSKNWWKWWWAHQQNRGDWSILKGTDTDNDDGDWDGESDGGDNNGDSYEDEDTDENSPSQDIATAICVTPTVTLTRYPSWYTP